MICTEVTGYPHVEMRAVIASGATAASSKVTVTFEVANPTCTLLTPGIRCTAPSIFFTQLGQVNGSVRKVPVALSILLCQVTVSAVDNTVFVVPLVWCGSTDKSLPLVSFAGGV